MLRVFSAFLSVFGVLSLVVHLEEMACLIGVGSLALLAIDLLAQRVGGVACKSKSPRDLLG